MAPQRLACFAAAHPVGPQHVIITGNPGGKLLGDRADVIRRRDEGAFASADDFLEIRSARRLGRVQHIPPVGGLGFASQLRITGNAPHVARYAESFGQNLLCPQGLSQDRPAAQQLDAILAAFGFSGRQLIDALDDAFLHAGRHFGHSVGFILDGQVVDRRLAFLIQLLQPIHHNHGGLISEGRIVRPHGGKGDCIEQAVAVLVLQALAVEGRAAGRSADHETFGPHVGGGPNQITDTLKAEHRIVDEERNHVDAVLAIGCAGGDERRHRPGLGDALLQNLPVLCLFVVQQQIGVDRLVQLAGMRVNADLPEHALHAERARFIRDDRNDVLADFLVAAQLRQEPHQAHRGRHLLALAAGEEFPVVVEFRHVDLRNRR